MKKILFAILMCVCLWGCAGEPPKPMTIQSPAYGINATTMDKAVTDAIYRAKWRISAKNASQMHIEFIHKGFHFSAILNYIKGGYTITFNKSMNDEDWDDVCAQYNRRVLQLDRTIQKYLSSPNYR